MVNQPTYAVTPVIGFGQVTAANANRDGTGTIVSLITATAPGAQLYEVVVNAQVTTTAGMVRLYLYNGTNYRLFDEIVVAAITVAAGVAGFRTTRRYANLILPLYSGSTYWNLSASTHNAEAMNVWAFGATLAL